MDKIKLIGFVIATLFVIILIFTSLPFVIVPAGQRGVVMKYGNVQETVLDEGLHWRTPFVDTVETISVRVQKADVQAQSASKDGQLVTIQAAVNWRYMPEKVNIIYQSVGGIETFSSTVLMPVTQEAIKSQSAKYNALQILEQREGLRQEIEVALISRLQNYNIIVDGVSLENIDFAPEFNQALEAKVRAEQEAAKAKNDLERIKFEAEQKVETAKAEAEAISIKGQALENNPRLVELEAVNKWNGVMPVNMYGNSPVPFINIPNDK